MSAKTISNGIAVLLLTTLVVNTTLANDTFVNSVDTTYFSIDLCEEACPLPNGLPCDDGTFTQVLTGSDGCDSVVISTLNIVEQIVYDATICEGDSIYLAEIDSFFTPIFEGGYGFEWNGCESGILLQVTFEIGFSFNIFTWTCNPGDCIDINDLVNVDTMVCPLNDTMFFIPSGMCGEGINVEILVFDPIPIDSFVFNNCPGDCVIFDGGEFCNDFSSTVNYSNDFDCDSIVYFEVNFYSGSPDPIRLAYCEGECALWEGVEYCIPVSMIDSFTTSNGCDSIVQISVEEIPTEPNILPADTIIELGDQIVFEIDFDNFSVSWNTGVDSSIFIFEADDFGPGLHPVYATLVNNDTGCLRQTDTTIVQVGILDGLNNSEKFENLIIYPNPVQQDHPLTLEIPTAFSNENISITWFDRFGQSIYSEKITNSPGIVVLGKHGGLSSGVYFVEISVGEFSAVRRVVVF